MSRKTFRRWVNDVGQVSQPANDRQFLAVELKKGVENASASDFRGYIHSDKYALVGEC